MRNFAFEEEYSHHSFVPSSSSFHRQKHKRFFKKQKFNVRGKVEQLEGLDSRQAERLYQNKNFQGKHMNLRKQLAEAQLHNDFVTVQNRKGQVPQLVMRNNYDPVEIMDNEWMQRQNSIIQEVKKVVGEEEEDNTSLQQIKEQPEEKKYEPQKTEDQPKTEDQKVEHVSVFELMNKLEHHKDWSYINILISYLEREGPLWYNAYPGLFDRMTGIIIQMNIATVDRLEDVYKLCTVWPHLMYKNFPKYSKIKRSNKQIVSSFQVGSSLEEHYAKKERLLLRTPTQKCCNEAIVAALSIPVDVGFGSTGSLEMLRSLERCKNDEIFKIPVIQGYLSYKWKQSVYFILIEATLYTIFLVLFNFFVLDSTARHSYVVFACLLMYWVVFVTREILQIIGRKKDYFLDVWNYIDLAVFVSLIGSLVSHLASSAQSWFMLCCLILMWIKFISYFRLSDRTRYLIRTILQIIKDMGPFLLIFLVMIISFACALASTFPDEYFTNTSFLERMYQVYNLVLGNPIHQNTSALNYFIFTVITILGLVILLNMLIALMGDTFSRVQANRVLYDEKERLSATIDFEVVVYLCNKKKSRLANIGVLRKPEGFENDLQKWEGVQTEIKKMLRELVKQNNEARGKMTEKVDKIDEKLDKITKALSIH